MKEMRKKKIEEMHCELNLDNGVLYVLYQVWVLLSFQVIIPKMLRQRYLLSSPYAAGLWRVHLSCICFTFRQYRFMVKHSKERLVTYQSNPIKYDYMHWASAGTFYFYLLSFIDFFFDIIHFPLVRFFTSPSTAFSLAT